MVNKKYKEIILSESIRGFFNIIIAFIPVMYAGISSIFTASSFEKILFDIPWYIYLLFVIIAIVVKIRLKMNEGKTDILKHWHIVPYKKVCFANAFDMKWDVEIPKGEPVNLINVYNNFDIPPKPKCEKCNVKLDYQDNFLWYTYDCFNCSFKKRTWQCLEKVTDHVNEVFSAKLEEDIKKKK